MKEIISHLIFLVLMGLTLSCSTQEQSTHSAEVATTPCEGITSAEEFKNSDKLPDKTAIPENFEAALAAIDALMNPYQRRYIQCMESATVSANLHLSFGRWIRNQWLYDSNSSLRNDLIKMGLFHEDDMSALLLRSYNRQLKGEAMHVEEQIQKAHAYWEANGINVKEALSKVSKK